MQNIKVLLVTFVSSMMLSGCLESFVQGNLPQDNNSSEGVSYTSTNKIGTGTAFTLAPTPSFSGDQIAAISPALPAGLSLDGLTGIISGTPTSASANTTYTVSIQSESGRQSTSFDLLVDATPPSSVVITDGVYQESLTELSFSWTPSTDAESGIASYEYAVGITTGAADFIDWTPTNVTNIALTGLNLASSQRYFISVRITNGANLTTTTEADGVFVGDREDNAWLTYYQEGDNVTPQVFGAKLCSVAGCSDLANFSYFETFPYTVSTPLGRSLIASPTGGSGNISEICDYSSCDNTTSLKHFGFELGEGYYYGGGQICDIETLSCSSPNAFTPRSDSYYYGSRALGGAWVQSTSGILNFLDRGTLNASSTGIVIQNAYTSPTSSYAWGTTISGANHIVYRCTNTGVCTNVATIPTSEGYGIVNFLVNNDGLTAWAYTLASNGSGKLRYCQSSSCTVLKTGLSNFRLVKNPSGTGVWLQNSPGTSIDYCTSASCTQLLNGSISLINQTTEYLSQAYGTVSTSASDDFVFAYDNASKSLLKCTTTSCSSVHTFVSAAVTVPDQTSPGVWAITNTFGNRKIFYCSDSSCTQLATFTFEIIIALPSKISSTLWYIENDVFSSCNTSSCSAIQSIVKPVGANLFYGNWVLK